MTQLITDTPTRVTTLSGHVLLFEPGVPQDVVEGLVAECRSNGCYPVGEQPEIVPEPEPISDVIVALQGVFNAILATGDPNHITADGSPRKNEVKARMQITFTPDEFSEAWDTFNSHGGLQTGDDDITTQTFGNNGENEVSQ